MFKKRRRYKILTLIGSTMLLIVSQGHLSHAETGVEARNGSTQVGKQIFNQTVAPVFNKAAALGQNLIHREDKCDSGKWITYHDTSECAKYDPEAIVQVLERNRFMDKLNETHEMIVQVARLTVEKSECLKQAMANRDQQLACTANFFAIREALLSSLTRATEYRASVGALNLPAVIKDGYFKSLTNFELSVRAALIEADRAIAKGIAASRHSLEVSLEKNSTEWRNAGANRVFCASLSAVTGASQIWLAAAYRSEMQADTYGVNEALAQLVQAQTQAVSGYKLCGIAIDEAYKKTQKAVSAVRSLAQRQDAKVNFKKACLDPSVQRWPELKLACKAIRPNDELLFSIHTALMDQYAVQSIGEK